MHGHVGPFYGCFLPSSAPLNGCGTACDDCGVQRIVCSHHSALACDVERGNRQMKEMVTSFPDRSWLLGDQPQSARTSPSSDLDGFRGLTGFVGLKFWPDYHLVPVNSPKYGPALEYADDARTAGAGPHVW